MNTRLILTHLQSSTCDLKPIGSIEIPSSELVNESGALEFPPFLAIDIEDSHPSDEDICHFLKTLATYTRDHKHIAPHVINRIIEILKRLQHRISKSNDSRDESLFIFPCLGRVTDLSRFETWTLHVLLSTQNTRLSAAVLNLFREDIPGSSRKDIMNALISGFIPSLLSALGEESLLSLPPSDPLHEALFAFLAQLIGTLKWSSWSTVATPSEELASPLLDHLLVTIRPLLILHLKSPTFISQSINHRFWCHHLFEDYVFNDKVPPNLQRLAVVHVLRQCANLRQVQNELGALLTGLMQEVWEERMKEGLVEDAVLPLFVSTPLRTNMTPLEMVPLLDSASAFLASTPNLSDADAVSVTLFLTSFDNMILVKSKKEKDVLSSAFVDSLSSCPPFATSVAKLMLLSMTCSHLEIGEERRLFWTSYIFRKKGNVKSVVSSGLFTHLAAVLQTLQSDWSDDDIDTIHCFFADVIEIVLDVNAPHRASLFSNSKIQKFRHTQQTVVNNVLVPLRQSLVHCARTNHLIVPNFDLLSCPDINHPDTIPFFEGVWDEVRREAIGLVCGDDRAAAPVFLTMNLFSHLSMEETQSGLSSLSSYLSTTPSPPLPVASCICVFLDTITTAFSLSLSEQENARHYRFAPWKDSLLQLWIRSNPTFANCFAQTIPTFFITSDIEIESSVRVMIKFVLDFSENLSEIATSLVDAGFISNLALVLMKPDSQTNSQYSFLDANVQCFLKVVSACLNNIPSSVNVSKNTQVRDSESRARTLMNVLDPSQPFLASLLAPLSLSRCVSSSIIHLNELLEGVGKAEWDCPILTRSLAKCGFHVATMRLCDLTEENKHQVLMLSLFGHDKPDSRLLSFERFFFNTPKPTSSSNRTVTTLRKRMMGRNVEGLEDLSEKNLLCPDLSSPDDEVTKRAKQFIINTGFNGWRIRLR
ncbi:hypothetical protein BLNAU_1588 [Blattamonas nauphoetae]|uniref:Uncharacterized protein n=1 Tax=Blattamonas nauphoetae TaxID=2049346 RepID=A0ABQ9YIR6_9EUKA|nr:hypothetical protein BLNAU_1588 [Blattamonas nauphoetae]